jgi:cytochrome c556
MGRAVVCAGAFALLVGCTRPALLAEEATIAETPVVTRHAVFSERVRDRMAALDELHRARLPQAMDVELERDRRALEVAEAARDLAEAAAELASLAPELSLDPAARERFASLARALERDSRSFAADAPILSDAAMRERARAIRGDCDRCHERFRAGGIPEAP